MLRVNDKVKVVDGRNPEIEDFIGLKSIIVCVKLTDGMPPRYYLRDGDPAIFYWEHELEKLEQFRFSLPGWF